MQLQANGIAIEIDDAGPVGGEPLLLIMGLGMQLVAWPDELMRELGTQGFRVIRFDNRDVGLSQGFDQLGVPNLMSALLRYTFHLPVQAPYTLADMAADAFGVLDALGIERAHVCGVSMGGMIAQHMAARRPERIKGLTLVMTSSGARHLPRATPRVQHVMFTRPLNPRDPAQAVAYLERLFGVIGSPAYRPDPEVMRQRMAAAVARAWRPHGTTRQLAAIVADADRSALLAHIRAPTCIVHGAADPMVPPLSAHDLHRKIGGSRLEIIEGMGHDLPAALMPRLARTIGAGVSR